LTDGGRFVFETRDPARRAWEEWTREHTHQVLDVHGDTVERWSELDRVELPLVTFRYTYVFASDGAVYTSDSTLRFRERGEIEESLAATGFTVDDVRDAPDRPGKEFVFVARKQ